MTCIGAEVSSGEATRTATGGRLGVRTTIVVWIVSSRVGHTTLLSSMRAPWTNFHSVLPCNDVNAATAASASANSTPSVRSNAELSPK